MRKYVFSLALILAAITLPAVAALPKTSLDWVAKIPDLKLISNKIESKEIEKTFIMKSNKPYTAIVDKLKKEGWNVVMKETKSDCPSMPTLVMVKGNQTFKVEVDKEEGDEGAYLELEVELEEN